MFLSKIMLNTHNKAAVIDIGNAYSMHQSLIKMYPDYDNSPNSKFLYRVEVDHHRNSAIILMQSMQEPDFDEKISSGYILSAQSKEYNPKFEIGQKYKFRLHANVVRKTNFNTDKDTYHRTLDKSKKILVPLYDEDEILKWISQKAVPGGFSIIGSPETAKFYQHSFKPGNKITQFGVRYDGTLSVINPSVFSESVSKGIGKGKAFGFGLLSLAFIRD